MSLEHFVETDLGQKSIRAGVNWGIGKILGYITNMLAVGVAAGALLMTVAAVAAHPAAFALLPQPTVVVDVASVSADQITQEQQTKTGERIFNENLNNQYVRSLAGMLFGQFNDRDIYSVKIQYVTDVDINTVANADLLWDGQPLTPDQRQSLAAYLVWQKQLTNQVVDSENAKSNGNFQTNTSSFGGFPMSAGFGVLYFCVFFLAALAGAYLIFVRSMRLYIREIGHTAILGTALYGMLVFVNLNHYKLTPGFALLSPLWGDMVRRTLYIGAITLAASALIYLLNHSMRVFVRDLGVILMTLLIIGAGYSALVSSFHPSTLPVFGVLFGVGFVLWFFTVGEGDRGYGVVSKILHRQPSPEPVVTESSSPLPGIVSLLVLAASIAVNYWLTLRWGGPFSAGQVTSTVWHQALYSVLCMVIGLDAWIGCIIATVQQRGRPLGISGIVLGVVAAFGYAGVMGLAVWPYMK